MVAKGIGDRHRELLVCWGVSGSGSWMAVRLLIRLLGGKVGRHSCWYDLSVAGRSSSFDDAGTNKNK